MSDEFLMTIGEARGFAEVIGHYPHLTMLDQWADYVHGGNPAVRIEPARDHTPMIVSVKTEPKREGGKYQPEDAWQVLRDGYVQQLTRGTEVVIGS